MEWGLQNFRLSWNKHVILTFQKWQKLFKVSHFYLLSPLAFISDPAILAESCWKLAVAPQGLIHLNGEGRNTSTLGNIKRTVVTKPYSTLQAMWMQAMKSRKAKQDLPKAAELDLNIFYRLIMKPVLVRGNPLSSMPRALRTLQTMVPGPQPWQSTWEQLERLTLRPYPGHLH